MSVTMTGISVDNNVYLLASSTGAANVSEVVLRTQCLRASFFYTPKFLILVFLLSSINIVVVGGNILVIAAANTSWKLKQSLTNSFIISLAASDLFLGFVVLPLSITYYILDKRWLFGTFLCHTWLAVDVWLSTASILNLVVIGLDRFLAICRPLKYPKLMTHSKAKILVACVWVLAFIICFPTIVTQFFDKQPDSGGSSPEGHTAVNQTGGGGSTSYCVVVSDQTCTIAASTIAYVVYSAMGSFFIPLLILCYFYWKIFMTVYRNARNLRRGQLVATVGSGQNNHITMRIHRGGGPISTESSSSNSNPLRRRSKRAQQRHLEPVDSVTSQGTETESETPTRHHLLTRRMLQRQSSSFQSSVDGENSLTDQPEITSARRGAAGSRLQSPIPTTKRRSNHRQSTSKLHRETKAARMLAIVCGTFIGCWMPFFSVYLVGAFLPASIPDSWFDIFFWLGYCNSALNPFIYALLSNDFRSAFKNLLCGRRMRKKRDALSFS